MKTEKEVRELARYYKEQSSVAIERMEHADTLADRVVWSTKCKKYNHMFAALVTVLGVTEDEFWRKIHDQSERDKIPLHIRLQRLTNPAPAGRFLERYV